MFDDYCPDDTDTEDKIFSELDEIVEITKSHIGESGYKYYISDLRLIVMMIEELDEENAKTDIREYQQEGDAWMVEVKYRMITYVSVTGKLPFSKIREYI